MKVRGECKITIIPIYKISENISVPTRTYTKQQILPLAESISHNGILQPLIVRKCTSYSYELISGKRRLQAAVMAGKTTVPCIILHCTKNQSVIYSLTENIQRNDYTYLELLQIMNDLKNRFDYSIEKLSQLFDKREFEIETLLKLNAFSSSDIIKLSKHQIPYDIASLLTEIDNVPLRSKILDKVVYEKLNFESVQRLVQSIVKPVNENIDTNKLIIKDLRIFHNSIRRVLETMKRSGLDPLESVCENDDYIRYTIRIPKRVNK